MLSLRRQTGGPDLRVGHTCCTATFLNSSLWCAVFPGRHFGGRHSAVREGKSVLSKMSQVLPTPISGAWL